MINYIIILKLIINYKYNIKNNSVLIALCKITSVRYSASQTYNQLNKMIQQRLMLAAVAVVNNMA